MNRNGIKRRFMLILSVLVLRKLQLPYRALVSESYRLLQLVFESTGLEHMQKKPPNNALHLQLILDQSERPLYAQDRTFSYYCRVGLLLTQSGPVPFMPDGTICSTIAR